MKKIMLIITAALTCILLMLSVSACGEDNDEATSADDAADNSDVTSDITADADFEQRMEELKSKELTVELIQDGETLSKWSQDGKGSWRVEDTTSADGSYIIYNAAENKGWTVSGTTAVELDTENMELYELSSPIVAMEAFGTYTMMPGTSISDDTWEWEVPGVGKVKIEFKGPDNLVSKIESEDSQTGSSVLEFKYSNVGNVPESTFELPSGVTVQSYDSTSGF